MSAKHVLATLGGLLLVGAIVVLGVTAVVIFIRGSAWASSNLLPWFSVLARIAFLLVIFVFLPLAIPRVTRGFSSIALFVASYVFGATLWMYGFLLTLLICGVGAVILGLIIAGIGVVPIAMVATLLKGMWRQFVDLILLAVMTFGCRVGAMSLVGTLEE